MIDLSQYIDNIKTKEEQGIKLLWAIIRKRWLIITPEEMIRQCVLHFLIIDRGYSSSLISVEKTITFYQLKKRYDIVVYNKKVEPLILIECKSSDTPLNQSAQEQIAIYDQIINGQLIWLTNGHSNIVLKKDADLQLYRRTTDIPLSELI